VHPHSGEIPFAPPNLMNPWRSGERTLAQATLLSRERDDDHPAERGAVYLEAVAASCSDEVEDARKR
jgi:hypothetical protein